MKEQKIRINADIFREHWIKETKCIAFELSDLECLGIYAHPTQSAIVVENTTSGGARRFEFTHKDTDGEDIFGWNYKSVDGIRLLLIND